MMNFDDDFKFSKLTNANHVNLRVRNMTSRNFTTYDIQVAVSC